MNVPGKQPYLLTGVMLGSSAMGKNQTDHLDFPDSLTLPKPSHRFIPLSYIVEIVADHGDVR